MNRISFTIVISGLLLLIFFSQTAQTESGVLALDPPDISTREIASGFTQPLAIVSTRISDDERLFIVEQGGKIKIVDGTGTVLPQPFLDINKKIITGNERGLLGLVFDPDYANNGYFYVNYTRTGDGATVIARYQVSSDPDVANPNSELLILRVQQPFSNHNAGDLHFGPDGYLYIPLGDGGSGYDPGNQAQYLGSLLGSLLRIDVDPTAGRPADCGEVGNYSIPNDNPYVGLPASADVCEEIWAYGLRNPFRASFDRLTGDFYMGDVGQLDREEVNFQPASSTGGEDYGWRCKEGLIDTPTITCDPGSDYVPPFFDYGRGQGNSVTGGYVYRGPSFPRMQGYYFFGDFATGRIWRAINDGGWTVTDLGQLVNSISAFGENSAGELFVLSYFGGRVYQIVDEIGLNITAEGPIIRDAGAPVVYNLTVENVGTSVAQNVQVTSTVPAGASYVSGGSHSSGVVTWNVGNLPVGGTTTVAFTVTAGTTITLTDYAATATGIDPIPGEPSVRTLIFDPLYRAYFTYLSR